MTKFQSLAFETIVRQKSRVSNRGVKISTDTPVDSFITSKGKA